MLLNPYIYNISEPTFIILRGVSGSGKSYCANKLKSLIKNYKTEIVYPSDFKDNNELKVNLEKLIEDEFKVFIFDDININISKIEPYITIAKDKSYQVFVIDINTPWSLNSKECLKKSSNKSLTRITYEINEMKQTITEPPKYDEEQNEDDTHVVLRFGDKLKKLHNKIKYMHSYI